MGDRHAQKIVECLWAALKMGTPVVGFNDSGGARIQEGVEALSGYGKIFYHNVLLSGVVPQISVIAGPCAGGAVYSPALTDFVIMVESTSHMFIAGPEVIRAATGEVISEEDLGGAHAQAAIAGNVHFVAADEHEAVEVVKVLLSYLPQNNMEGPPDIPFEEALLDDEALDWIIPEDPRQAYDVRDVITRLVDHAVFLEVQAVFAPNIVVGFGRMAGMVVGHRRQPAGGHGRGARHQRRRQGRALHPHLQRLQHSGCDAHGRAWLPAGRRPGARRHHPPRRQDALHLRLDHRAQGHRDPPQGLRRRLPRHVLQGHRGRLGAGLADRRDRGHGTRGSGARHLPQGAQEGRRPAGPDAGEDRRSTATPTPTPIAPPRRSTSTTSSARRGRSDWSWSGSGCCAASATCGPRRSTGTSPCEPAMLEALKVFVAAFATVFVGMAILTVVLYLMRWAGRRACRRRARGARGRVDPQLVAVLAAAAAEALGRAVVVHHVHIHRERATELWSRAGRMDIMVSHRVERKR